MESKLGLLFQDAVFANDLHCYGPSRRPTGARANFENNIECLFLVNCICTHATGSRTQNTRRGQKARHSKWNCSEHFN